MSEVNVATLDVVKHTASSAHKDLDAPFKLTSLVLNGDTTVDSEGLVLIWVMLNLGEHILNLDSQFTGRCEYNSLDFAGAKKLLLSEILDDRQCEGESFA